MNRKILSVLGIGAIFCMYCASQSIEVQDSRDKRIVDLDQANYLDTAYLE